jgi:ligand-binding sensor domain-containing protein
LKKGLTILLLVVFFHLQAATQPVSFSHLTTANGLSDNKVHCATMDQNGFLWIGTANGLNRYDGYSVTTYFRLSEPQLCFDNITEIFCDSKNRIWVATARGVTMIDELRKFHKIIFNDSIQTNYRCSVILEAKSSGIVLYTSAGHYCFDEKANRWLPLDWSTAEQSKITQRDNTIFEGEQHILTGRNKLVMIDYASRKMIFEFNLPYAFSACRINSDEIMAATYKGKLLRINIRQKKIIKEYPLTKIENGKVTSTNIVKVRQAANGHIIVSTGLSGLVIVDPLTDKIMQYAHDPLNRRTLSETGIGNISCDAKGNVFVSGTNQGLDYFNINHYSASYLAAFTGKDNEIYDGGFNYITQDAGGKFMLGGDDCIIEYNSLDNSCSIHRYYYPIPDIGERALRVTAIAMDDQQRIWVCTKGGGMGVFNRSTGQFTIFSRDTLSGRLPRFSNNFINDIERGSNGTFWLGTYTGLVQFNTNTYTYDEFVNHPVLKTMHQKSLLRVFTDKVGKLWLGYDKTRLYCYDKINNKLKLYSTNQGLVRGEVNALAEDDHGNMYVATTAGLSIIDKQDKIKNYTALNGLKYDECQALLKDNDGNIWISNHQYLIKYSPVNNTFSYYDERSGLTGENFRVNAAYVALDGQLYWGTEKGIIYFDPARLINNTSFPQLLVSRATIADSNYQFTTSSSIDLKHYQNSASFYFTAPDIYSNKRTKYQYQLTGLDKTWINNFEQRQVNYNSLPPGNYGFKVRFSTDGVNWKESVNQIRLNISPAFWQTWGFKLLLISLVAGLIVYFFRWRVGSIKGKEKIKTNYERKIAEVEMISLRAQMNPHFMFNSLNSINNFILKNDPDNASGYLTKFSRLMRLILDNSRSEWVPLENELKALELYITLESLRFENSFTYYIDIAKDMDTVTAFVPPMIIQPYVENAIWHGLLHRKQVGAKLDIKVWENGGIINVVIEDNGIGRNEAGIRKSKSAVRQKSHGMEITAQRLDIVNKLYNVNAKVTINDLVNEQGEATGTSVLLNLKYRKHDSRNSG